jgi:putative DNA primase/helicase
MGNPDSKQVGDAARGQWLSILEAVSPALRPALVKPGAHVGCPKHGGHDGFRFFRDSDEAGNSICNTCGENKDGFATLMMAEGVGFREALERVADYLGGNFQRKPDSVPRPAFKPEQSDSSKAAALLKMWNEAVPLCTPEAEHARRYFTEERGLPITGWGFENLRYHPSIYYGSGHPHDKGKTGMHPGILAMLQQPDGQRVTIQRTYLSALAPKKADVTAAKKSMPYPKSLRTYVTSAIRLDPPAPVMGVAEGLENTFSGRYLFGMSSWAVCGKDMLKRLTVCEGTRVVVIFADDDKLGQGREAAEEGAAYLAEHGVRSLILMPPQAPHGPKGLDWNDVIRHYGVASFQQSQYYHDVIAQINALYEEVSGSRLAA